jgi:hypothetical protein
VTEPMPSWSRTAQVVGAGALGLLLGSCGDDCPGIASCVYPVAMVVTISSATGGPVANVSLQVSGPALGPATCTGGATATLCTVAGEGGVYALVVEAPGFMSAQRSVTVRSTIGQCDCPIVTTESVSVSLSRVQ